MHERASEFQRRAETSVGFAPDIEELPEGTHTAADAASAIGIQLEQIVKSMVMVGGTDLVLVLTSGPHAVDEAKLATELDVPVETVGPADADRVKTELGWSIGGVPPFAHDRTLPAYFDETLLAFDEVWAGAGTPTTVFPIDPETLLEVTDATVADVFATG